MNVEDRFNPQVDDGYSKNYKDWSIKVLFSLPCRSKEDAEYLEKLYLEKRFPYKSKYKVWVEDLFGLEDRNYYYDNTGVTELRLLTVEEKNKTLNELFLLKRKLGGKVFTVEKESV
jgi:hypothetical protein